jgi:hypothetical protein
MFVKDDCIYITGTTYNNSPDPVHALTQKYRLDIPSAISSIQERPALFDVHPNPAQEVLHIDLEVDNISTAKDLEVKIYDAVGQLVKQAFIATTSTDLNLKELPNGVYFVNIQAGQRSLGVQKVVIAR